jgi:hypothetical protein
MLLTCGFAFTLRAAAAREGWLGKAMVREPRMERRARRLDR